MLNNFKTKHNFQLSAHPIGFHSIAEKNLGVRLVDMEKPTLYICIEIKNREYDSQILLALHAALHGYRVYLGSHAAIYSLLKNKKSKGGIFLDKSTQPRSRILWNREKVEFYCVLDAELSPVLTASTAKKAFPSRIYPNVEPLIDRFLVVGPIMERIALEYFGTKSVPVRVTGWPRIDIWAQHGEAIYEKEISNLKSKYGKYLLFASSFGNVRDPKQTVNRNNADPIQQTELNTFQAMLDQHLNFKKAVQMLQAWDRNTDFPTVIVRPHTSEPISVWKKELGKLKKTFIYNDGDIAPWIYASEGLIHNGSTTAIQAYFAKKPTYIIKQLTLESLIPISIRVSKYVLGKGSMELDFKLSSLTPNPEFNSEILQAVIYTPTEGAVSRVIQVFKELTTNPTLKHKRLPLIYSQLNRKSAMRALGLIRDEIFWKLGKTNINSQLHFIPGGLDKKPIKMVKRISPEFAKIRCKRMTLNLWEFDL